MAKTGTMVAGLPAARRHVDGSPSTPRKGLAISPVSGPSSSGGRRPAPGTLAGLGEFALIEALVAGIAPTDRMPVGPGDDAAVLTAPDGRVVVSTDVLVDGVHFRADWASGEQIGRRAALAALSDIAAMGAVPTAVVVGLSAPGNVAADLVLGIGKGLREAAGEAGAVLAGGDVTRSDVLTLAVTVLGDLGGRAPVLRSGAQPGDLVAVAGRLGWAAAGLTVLSRGFRSPVSMVNAYRVPEPPLELGPVAAGAGATAMIDVSDGLLADLGHIATASGVAIDVRTSALEINPRLQEVASALGRDPLDWVLTGGDDHALAATFPSKGTLPLGFDVIGRVFAADAPAVTVDGAVREGVAGWQHFR